MLSYSVLILACFAIDPISPISLVPALNTHGQNHLLLAPGKSCLNISCFLPTAAAAGTAAADEDAGGGGSGGCSA